VPPLAEGSRVAGGDLLLDRSCLSIGRRYRTWKRKRRSIVSSRSKPTCGDAVRPCSWPQWRQVARASLQGRAAMSYAFAFLFQNANHTGFMHLTLAQSYVQRRAPGNTSCSPEGCACTCPHCGQLHGPLRRQHVGFERDDDIDPAYASVRYRSPIDKATISRSRSRPQHGSLRHKAAQGHLCTWIGRHRTFVTSPAPVQ